MMTRTTARPSTSELRSKELFRYASHCVTNADELLRAANLLVTAGIAGSARSLAFTAEEECGKAILAVLCAFGQITRRNFRKAIGDHQKKQAFAVVGQMMNVVLSANVHRFAGIIEGLPEDNPSSAREVFAERLRTVLGSADLMSAVDMGSLPERMNAALEKRSRESPPGRPVCRPRPGQHEVDSSVASGGPD
jgi:AbiV family abortive infection protein